MLGNNACTACRKLSLKSGATYSIYTGGSCTGTLTDGLYSGGTYSGGTQYKTITLSSKVTSK